MLDIKNVSSVKDKYYEQFGAQFIISDFGYVLLNEEGSCEPVKRNIAKEFNLKLKACDFGGSSLGIDKPHPGMLNLENALKNKFGQIRHDKLTSDFRLALEIGIPKGKLCYCIGSGNNHQEVSCACYISDKVMLDDKETVNSLKEIDDMMFTIVSESGLERMYS